MNEWQKTINNLDRLVYVDRFTSFYIQEVKLRDKMKDLQNRIYHQFTPDPNTIKIETKDMMSLLFVDELYIENKKVKIKVDTTVYSEDLYILAPNEIKTML